MDAQKLLKSTLPSNKPFTAGFVIIDIIGSSRMTGTSGEIARTKRALNELVESQFGNAEVACLYWQGDGGALVYYGANSDFDELILICDKILALLPFFNRSKGILSWLENDYVHLRIVAHAGETTNTGSASHLNSDALNELSKFERDVGVRDHLVITHEVFKRLSPLLKKRFVRRKESHNKLGDCYILDDGIARVEVQLHPHTSENIRKWIAASVELGYNEVDIFSYTNETLYKDLGPLPDTKIRVLTRSWTAEARDESKYNEQVIGKAGPQKRLWRKSEIIKQMAKIVSENEHVAIFYNNNLQIRFYESRPLFKGAILRDSHTNRRAAHIGFYSWEPERLDEGTPYVGENWSGLWLVDDGGSQSKMLNAIQSAFEEAWQAGLDFPAVKAQEKESKREITLEKNVNSVWEIDKSLPYLVIVGDINRKTPSSAPFNAIATEDLMALRTVESLLKKYQAHVEFEIIATGQDSIRMPSWEGHLVVICRRSINEEISALLTSSQCPYAFVPDTDDRVVLTDLERDIRLVSPLDIGKQEYKDYGLVAKCPRPNNRGKMFVLAGIHGMGTWGGAVYLTDANCLRRLVGSVEDKDFATIIECKFEVPQRVNNIRTIMGPQIL